MKIIKAALLIFIICYSLTFFSSEENPLYLSKLQKFLSQTKITNSFGDLMILTNINSMTNTWYVLEIRSKRLDSPKIFHLEITYPDGGIYLAPDGLFIRNDGETNYCRIINVKTTESKIYELDKTATENEQESNIKKKNLTKIRFLASDFIVKPLVAHHEICGGWAHIRGHEVSGYATVKELAVAKARESGLGSVVEIAKSMFLDDSEEATVSEIVKNTDKEADSGPLNAFLANPEEKSIPGEHQIGILYESPLYYGYWSKARNFENIFVSLLHPSYLPESILKSWPERVRKLRGKEPKSLVYLVAIDVSHYGFGFVLGTEFPEIGWSYRSPNYPGYEMPGPDGITTTYPLGRAGIVNPALKSKVAATFAGGFKRGHGAFSMGKFAEINNGSHYGFMENGTIFSKINPFLATAMIENDGTMNLLTWPQSDKNLLKKARHIRQNGLPIIESHIPGSRVSSGTGSWSGDQKGDPVTMRSGICYQESSHGKYLIFAMFTAATPSLMARVFQAYQCSYAMMLDINAPMHTFFALSKEENGIIRREYLNTDMEAAEPSTLRGGGLRFLTRPDERDFFYVVKKYLFQQPYNISLSL